MQILGKQTHDSFTEVSTLSVLKENVCDSYPKSVMAGSGGMPGYLGSLKTIENSRGYLFSPLSIGHLSLDSLSAHLYVVLLSLDIQCVK